MVFGFLPFEAGLLVAFEGLGGFVSSEFGFGFDFGFAEFKLLTTDGKPFALELELFAEFFLLELVFVDGAEVGEGALVGADGFGFVAVEKPKESATELRAYSYRLLFPA